MNKIYEKESDQLGCFIETKVVADDDMVYLSQATSFADGHVECMVKISKDELRDIVKKLT